MSLLVVEDNPVQALLLRRALTDRQFEVDVACDGEEALKLGDLGKYEVILLDLGLPKIDGLSLLGQVRASGARVPVMVVSCHEDVEKRVEALQAGADDYVCKPFHIDEIMARIRALLRRPPAQFFTLRVADLEMDCIQRTVRRGSTRIHLGRIDFAILEFLMRNAGHPVSRAKVMEHIWDNSFDRVENIVDVYISRLRRKIDHGHEKELIRTVRGAGYTIMDPDASDGA